MPGRDPQEQYSDAIKMAIGGDLLSAIATLKKDIKQHSDYYQGWILLSKFLFQSKQFAEAISVADKAEGLDPLHNEFGQIQMSMQRQSFDDAKRIASQMLNKIPGHPRAIFTLAHIASIHQLFDQSVEVLNKGLATSPANLTLRSMLTENLTRAGDFSEAIDSAKQLTELNASFDSLWLLISLQLKYGQHEALLESCARIAPYCGKDTRKLSQLNMIKGQALRIIGQREQCIEAFRTSISANPHNVDAWCALADMKNYQFSGEEMDKLKHLIQTSGLPPKAKGMATFSYAKAMESAIGIKQAMVQYHNANRLLLDKRFSVRDFENDLRGIRTIYSQETLATQAEIDRGQVTPIFIVGLPRSGSTLLEQILASHSHIEGTLEQPTFPAIERKANSLCLQKLRKGLATSLKELTASDLTSLARDFHRKSQLFRHTNAPFFTDKLPFNFRQIGLIHKVLPQAVIIDIRRNPMDCGLSLYKQYFTNGVNFSYDLAQIGSFYKAYVELMDYWHRALPGKVLHVQYEELVSKPDETIRYILSHIGVEFEPACLDFHKTNRVVHTASSEQVRQPINTKGIGLWKEVEGDLADLKASLGDLR